ncbi:uncharacterized protein LOC133223318 [Neopsephotus bourkii]|uniref:uncharacterized protein LOC133223318 n=1 Tax=Neopsephotus bourkii TaxID=309878 RepID=UPI002AA5D907|nr:uncharacterized protein LOC133223318 [Neopsephotus bourkii]
MEAPWPHSGLWGLVLLPPTLLLAAICARCRRPHGPAPPAPSWFSPPSDVSDDWVHVAPPPRPRSSPLPPPPRAPPPAEEHDEDYTNDPYVTGYVDVIPDEASDRTAPPGGDYENVPDGAQSPFGGSLEYINLPAGGASESEDNGGDYENF